jgi:predicted RNase H-like HicB family nuclease
MKYAIVIERSARGFGACVPDLPGSVAVGENEGEVRRLIRTAIALHLEALREQGGPVPEPTSRVEYVEVAGAS